MPLQLAQLVACTAQCTAQAAQVCALCLGGLPTLRCRTAPTAQAFYEHPVLKPYVFFDVAHGQERRREGGGSVSNQVGLQGLAGRLRFRS